ncbi:MAG: hypothetical protein RDV41_08725 [Planctomycetota bacterium]|nr:hypothetical protein [Planctomycetota bacterium]
MKTFVIVVLVVVCLWLVGCTGHQRCPVQQRHPVCPILQPCWYTRFPYLGASESHELTVSYCAVVCNWRIVPGVDEHKCEMTFESAETKPVLMTLRLELVDRSEKPAWRGDEQTVVAGGGMTKLVAAVPTGEFPGTQLRAKVRLMRALPKNDSAWCRK